MELNYNKELFKELLATLGAHASECKEYTANTVVFFNAKAHSMQEGKSTETIPYYSELSSGKFEIASEDEALREKFLRTKALIAKYHEHTTE